MLCTNLSPLTSTVLLLASLSQAPQIMSLSVTPSSEIGTVHTLVGTSSTVNYGFVDGIGTNSRMLAPVSATISSDDSFALVVDSGNYKIRRYNIATGAMTTVNETNGDDLSDASLVDAHPILPLGVCFYNSDTLALITDSDNNKIRVLVVSTGVVTTLAGRSNVTGAQDGPGRNATFAGPSGVSVSATGEYALVADSGNGRIRKIILTVGMVSTLAGFNPEHDVGVSSVVDGVGANATFNFPSDVRISPDGTFALVADKGNNKIRKLDLSVNPTLVSTFAGPLGDVTIAGDADLRGENATFNGPTSITFSPDGTYVLVTDTFNNKIRMIVISTRAVSTIAGPAQGSYNSWPYYDTDGTGTDARFFFPQCVVFSATGNFAIVADTTNNKLRRLVLSTAAVTTIAGASPGSLTPYGTADGTGTNAKVYEPSDVCYSSDGTFALIADTTNNKIRKLVLSTGVMTTFIGPAGSDTTSGDDDGVLTAGRLNRPNGIAISFDDSFALVADTNNHKIRKIVLSTGELQTFAGPREGSVYFYPDFGADGQLADATFYNPSGVSISADGSFSLVADTSNNKIRMIDMLTGTVTTLAGPGPGTMTSGSADGAGHDALFRTPRGVTISPDSMFALVADTSNNKIRKINLATASVTTFAGSTSAGSKDAVGTDARFSGPRSVKISTSGVFVVVADTNNNKIRRVELSTASVTTLAGPPAGSSSSGDEDGQGTSVLFYQPRGISLSSDGTMALIADTRNNYIRLLSVLGTFFGMHKTILHLHMFYIQ